MMIAYQFWLLIAMAALGHCRPNLDRVEERNEELSGPDVTFAYHNPPNNDGVVKEEETEDGTHRLSKRLVEPPQSKLVYLDPLIVVDDKTYSNLINASKSPEEQQQYSSNKEDDLEVAAAIVYRPLFAYRLLKSRRLARRRNPRSIHSTLPVDSRKNKFLYRTDNDLMSKVRIIFLPVYTPKGRRDYDTRSSIKTVSEQPETQQKKEDEDEKSNEIVTKFVEVFEDGDPLEPAESSVVHPLFLYRYRVAYYEKKEEKEKKRRQQ